MSRCCPKPELGNQFIQLLPEMTSRETIPGGRVASGTGKITRWFARDEVVRDGCSTLIGSISPFLLCLRLSSSTGGWDGSLYPCRQAGVLISPTPRHPGTHHWSLTGDLCATWSLITTALPTTTEGFRVSKQWVPNLGVFVDVFWG